MSKKAIKISTCSPEEFVSKIGQVDKPYLVTVLDVYKVDLSELKKDWLNAFINVQVLSLRRCKLIEIPSQVGSLQKLTKLFLGGNRINRIPVWIKNLKYLSSLQISSNQIKHLPEEIGELFELKYLWINNNLIRSLPESISQLRFLKKIYASKNLIQSISREILAISALEGIYLENNPLDSIPIYDKSGNILNSLRTYFDSIKDGDEKVFDAKVIFIGSGAVGKTTLIQKIISQHNRKDYLRIAPPETKGLKVHNAVLDNIKDEGKYYEGNIKIWDFGGQEIQSEVHHIFLSDETLYILMWSNRVVNNKNRYIGEWLNKVESYGKNGSRVLIVQSMYGEENSSSAVLNREVIKKLFDPLVVGFHNISSHNNIGVFNSGGLVDSMRSEVYKLPHVGKKVSLRWIEIKNEIISKKERLGKTLSISKFFSICETHGVYREESLMLLAWFHNTGVVLYYNRPISLGRRIFLDPDWVTDIIYSLIIDDKKKILSNNGRLILDTYDLLKFSEEELYVLDLMEKFDLCFPISSDKDIFIVPSLLPIQKKLDFAKFSTGQVIRFRFYYKIVSSSTIPRFVSSAYKNGLVFEDEFCRNGVILNFKDSHALVQVPAKSKTQDDNYVHVSVVGETKWYLAERVRELLANIEKPHNKFKESVACVNGINCSSKEYHYFERKLIEKANDLGISELQCQNCLRGIPVKNLIHGLQEGLLLKVDKIKECLVESDIEGALFLLKSLRGKNSKEIVLLSSRFYALMSKDSMGTMNGQERDIELNKIKSSILNLANTFI